MATVHLSTIEPPTITAGKYQPFPFLDLPPEIRNSIYTLLLTHNTPICARYSHVLSCPFPVGLNLHPAILGVSRQLHKEAAPILYGQNRFQAHPTWLTDVTFALDPAQPITSARCVAQMRRFHLRVRVDCDPYYGPEALVKAFSGMDEFEVEVFRASYGIGDHHILEAFKGIRGVKKARVHGSVEREFASWLEKCMESEGVTLEECGNEIREVLGYSGNRNTYDMWTLGNR